LAHEVTLLSAEICTLRKANEALSKRRRAKKTYVRQGGALTIEDRLDVLAQKEVEELVRRDKRIKGGDSNEGQLAARCYGIYRKTSHNARTCQEDIDMSSLLESN
jgi:hypothetical protein